MRILATGPSASVEELDALRQAGHDSPLRAVDPERMILTPHNVSHSEAGRRANLKLALDQILAAGRGEPPAHVANPDAIPHWRRTR